MSPVVPDTWNLGGRAGDNAGLSLVCLFVVCARVREREKETVRGKYCRIYYIEKKLRQRKKKH